MKRTILTCVSVGLCGVANAADMPAYDPAPSAPVSYATTTTYDWSGAYLGASLGYLWADADYTAIDAIDPDDYSRGDVDVDGWTLGAYAGYNVQFGSIVLGLEGDIAWSGADGSDGNTPTGVGSPSGVDVDIDWLGTLRGRAGYALDRFMVYGTGGLAYASTEMTVDDLGGAATDIDDEDGVWGWTIGAGVEAAVTQNVIVKAEYLYTDFGEAEYTFTDAGVPVTTPIDADIDSHSMKVGVSYKF